LGKENTEEGESVSPTGVDGREGEADENGELKERRTVPWPSEGEGTDRKEKADGDRNRESLIA